MDTLSCRTVVYVLCRIPHNLQLESVESVLEKEVSDIATLVFGVALAQSLHLIEN
jgi:hypothetical protein